MSFLVSILLSYTAARQKVARRDYGLQLDSLHLAEKESIHCDCERGEYLFLYMEPYVVCGYDGE